MVIDSRGLLVSLELPRLLLLHLLFLLLAVFFAFRKKTPTCAAQGSAHGMKVKPQRPPVFGQGIGGGGG
ncbi:hypothetical protein N7451_000733 [Penicillium sp. IBT 35674x]|nr:hypothetical protein N7451_000733 [Penicillium sp. IBT 35674x]